MNVLNGDCLEMSNRSNKTNGNKRGIKNRQVIGIDLGTSDSCVAVVEAGEPKVITNSEGAELPQV